MNIVHGKPCIHRSSLASLDDTVSCLMQCLDQLVRFERAGILQTDMKSKNVVINDEDDLTIIDYGSCQLQPEVI